MPFRRVFAALSALLVLSVVVAGPASVAAQAAAEEYDGAAAMGLSLRRLGTTARVLHIAAHPDDENTALLSALALGQGADVAYLSLTRGEGGQNSIGPELSTGLGIIRSEELVAARRLDGARQFFTRAIDYGYSKSAEEALRRWPHEELLADVVEVIRRYRPDVVVSVWSGTDRDGHGQHQASGIVAREAVLAAGDPNRFPEQLEAGLRPHTPRMYYRSAWFAERPPDVELNTGFLDPLLGRSYHQVAMASRSLHRSQDQGRRLEPGPRRTSFHRVDPARVEPVADAPVFGRHADGAPATDHSIFEGVDTLLSQRASRLSSLAGSAGGGQALPGTAELLREYEEMVRSARREHDPFEPWRLLPTLSQAQHRLTAVADLLEGSAGGSVGAGADRAARDLHFHLTDELDDLGDALLTAANVRVDAVVDREWVVPGQTVRLELGVWNGGPATIRAQAGPLLPAGWIAHADEDIEELTVGPGDRVAVTFDVTVPSDAEFTAPYYLAPPAPATPEAPEAPAAGEMYRWPDDPDIRGLPFAPAPVRGSFLVVLPEARPIALDREAVWIGVDRRAGEYRRPVKVVPAASVSVTPDLIVLPTRSADPERELAVRVRSHSPAPVAGDLRLILPAGWTATPDRLAVRLDDDREHVFPFRVRPPAGVAAGEHRVRAVLATAAGDLDLGFQVIDYPHITPRHLYSPASARVRVLDVEVAPVRVGYVEGASDGIPAALDRLGVAWQPLLDGDLADGDLTRFDVIITGTRAYELRPDLVENNRRLLAWVREGGTLIVQYNQYAALQHDYTPWPVSIARPHGRVTDQDAPVRVLEPDHPVLSTPNRIVDADWGGWVQERGLYFLDTWDGPLTPLLAMSDPGEEPLTGALLVAPLGSGTWIYSGLALFRQLPEGVPGAYRLLANLISLGARP
jgi:LmbE family N-acetylglucosaminyl deacetylase